MSKLQSRFEQLISDQAELQRKFQEQAQEMFKEITKEFFDKNPGITGVVWTQYTPYFNDGDTCEFSVNEATFTNAPVDELEDIRWGEYEGETEGVWACDNVAHALTSDREWYKETADKIRASGGVDAESCKLLSEAIGSGEMETVMQAMFGDHVKVIATRDGFDVQDYDHD
jgi:Zn-finger protein